VAPKLKIAIVAGELSGDALGSSLMKELYKINQNIDFEGIAGPSMQALGAKSLANLEDLSVMGLFEVLKSLPKILAIKRKLIKHFKKVKPDLYIGIDAPDFNLRMSKALKKFNIKTVQYVSPSIWAWRENRVHFIKKNIDLVLNILPFESKFYHKHQVKSVFVGHPCALNNKENYSSRNNTLLLLPGSRIKEINNILETILKAAKKILTVIKLDLHIVAANQKIKNIIQEKLNEYSIKASISQSDAHIHLKQARLAILASGTIALEAMVFKCPMLVVYKINHLTYAIVKRMIKIKLYSLPNIIADQEIVPELIQNKCTASNIAFHALGILIKDYNEINKEFNTMTQKLITNSNIGAKACLELIDA